MQNLSPGVVQALADIRHTCEGNRLRHLKHGHDLNVFSTPGARYTFQQGWDGVQPPNAVDGSVHDRIWQYGKISRELDDAANKS